MEFLEIYNNLKLEEENKICMIRLGAFFVALGIDVYILNEVLKLKITSFGKSIKVGIPCSSLEKYVSLMKDIPYVIYDYCSKSDLVYNGKMYYVRAFNECDFCFASEKLNHFVKVFRCKINILKCIRKYLSGKLGEVV